jgi:hypothetical protein
MLFFIINTIFFIKCFKGKTPEESTLNKNGLKKQNP